MVTEGRRARSGATWGLVGGWGDCPSVSGDGRAPVGGAEVHNGASQESKAVKAAGPAAPWATVYGVPAAVGIRDAVGGGRVVATVGGSIGQGPVVAFEDERVFRDAMDGLGLLVGLGQQEVLTLVSWCCTCRFNRETFVLRVPDYGCHVLITNVRR